MAEMDKEAAEKLQELQILEGTFQNLLIQKQMVLFFQYYI